MAALGTASGGSGGGSVPGGKPPPGGGARPPRLRLGLSRWPTGMASVLSGVLALIAAIYLGGRGAYLPVIGLAGVLVGVGTDFAVTAAQRAPATGRRGAVAGAIGAAMALVVHMQITNSGACAVAWMGLLVYGLPLTLIGGGIGGAVLVHGLARGEVPARRGGDRALWPVLVLALAVAMYATVPVAVNAVSYSQVLTRASLRIERADELTPGGGWATVRAEPDGTDGLALRLDYSVYPPRRIEVYGPEGRLEPIPHEFPDGSGSPRLLSDASTGVVYVVWSQPTAGSTWERPEYQIYVRRLDAGAAGDDATAAADPERLWVLPAASGDGWPGELRLIHGEYALVAREPLLVCYRLDHLDQDMPTEAWRYEFPDGVAMLALGGGTVVAAGYGRETVAVDLARGTLLWRGLEATCTPAYDQAHGTWIIAGQQTVQARDCRDGSLRWSGPLDDATPVQAGRGAPTARFPSLLLAGERLLVLDRPLEATLSPHMGALLTARNPATGQVLWQRRLERAAQGILGQTSGGVVLVTGSQRLLLGFDAVTGDQLFRAFPGIISHVLELGTSPGATAGSSSGGDEALMLLDELGRIVYVTIKRGG